MGLSESGAREIIAMQPIYVSGELHAREYSRRFDVANTEIRLQRDPNGPGGFQLLIDRQPAHAWFRQRYVELMTRLGLPRPPRTPRPSGDTPSSDKSQPNKLAIEYYHLGKLTLLC
ncbi:Plasmid recombination enzyme [human gut metagenome]|uniref:Plasmid recombination enzyme n=1 Tax=human gut metagenome TaxID=408170 RepID=K1T2Q8_9ZZZZ